MTGAVFLKMDAGPKPWGRASLLHLDCLAPKILRNHFFQFLLGITVIPREIKKEIKKNGHAEFFLFFFWGGGGTGGVTKVHYGVCEKGK